MQIFLFKQMSKQLYNTKEDPLLIGKKQFSSRLMLGTGKYIAFLVMGMAMFLCMPIVLTRKAFMLLLPAKCQTLLEKLVMGLFCVLSIVISRSFM